MIVKSKSKMFNGKNMHIRLRHNIVWQLLETRVICKTPTLLNVIMVVVELIRGPLIKARVD